MELRAKGKFYRDLEKYGDRELAKAIREALRQMQGAKDISQILNLRKLKHFKRFYRAKVMDNYRIGIEIRKNLIILVCFGHRHNFYKKFP